VVAEYLTQRVFVWDATSVKVRCWHLLVLREIGGSKLNLI